MGGLQLRSTRNAPWHQTPMTTKELKKLNKQLVEKRLVEEASTLEVELFQSEIPIIIILISTKITTVIITITMVTTVTMVTMATTVTMVTAIITITIRVIMVMIIKTFSLFSPFEEAGVVVASPDDAMATLENASHVNPTITTGKIAHWSTEIPHQSLPIKENKLSILQSDCKNIDKSDITCSNSEIVNVDESFEYEQGTTSVKGRLKKCIKFWEEIGANSYILSVIDKGYKIPLVTIPEPKVLRNNKSSMENHKFVVEAISELLSSKSVVKVDKPPYVVNPLTVSINAKGKKRLVLDLRHVNPHVWKEKIKFDDWKIALNYIEKGKFMFGFDLKSGYHHLDIHKEFQQYLGFSWVIDGVLQYFVFTVLPFGLSSAGHIFTKTVRCLIGHWRAQSIQVLAFLDDGLGASETYELALHQSKIVFNDLVNSGFVPNQEKSQWQPIQDTIFLGIGVNTCEGILYIPEKKLLNISSQITKALVNRKLTARMLAGIIGKITSVGLVVGNVTRLMTKHMHMAVIARNTWDSYFALSDDVITELSFWDKNLRGFKVRPLHKISVTNRVVFSDASSVACGGYVVGVKDSVCHRMWSESEKLKSSTWRELVGVHTVLNSLKSKLQGQSIKWFTDNQAVASIVEKGSMKPELQNYALDIYKFCIENSISMDIEWVPRLQNQTADLISNIVDYDDWEVTTEFFSKINSKWGPFTVDRFANVKNHKVKRYNSRFWSPGTIGTDAFAYDWKGENNWLVPRVIKHLCLCKALGVLVVPLWKTACFGLC